MQKGGVPNSKIDKLNNFVGKWVSFSILVLIALMVYETIARYIFNSPTMWNQELSEFIFAGYFLLGGGYTLLHEGHVRVDIFYNKFNKRGQLVSDVSVFIFFVIFAGILTWKSGEMAFESVMAFETTQSAWRPYVFPVIAIIPIAAFLMLLQGISSFLYKLKQLFVERYDHEH